MSYVSNQYNYATPLSSAPRLVTETTNAVDGKFFTLHSNTLDGSYKVISGEVGIWGSEVSDANGVLAKPLVLTVTENVVINAFRLTGSAYAYPVAFTVRFYNGSALVYTISETANSAPSYIKKLSSTVTATSYTVTVTKTSPKGVVRLLNVYNPGYVARSDTMLLKSQERTTRELLWHSADTVKIKSTEYRAPVVKTFHSKDTAMVRQAANSRGLVTAKVVDMLRVKDTSIAAVRNNIDTTSDMLTVSHRQGSAIRNTAAATDTLRSKLQSGRSKVANTIDVTSDTLYCDVLGEHEQTNVHTRMKEASRRIYGKTYITYTDPLVDSAITITDGAYGSAKAQLLDNVTEAQPDIFRLCSNDLSGKYTVYDDTTQVGWFSKTVSDASGSFAQAATLSFSFTARPVPSISLFLNADCLLVDFTVTFSTDTGPVMRTVSNNDKPVVTFSDVNLASVHGLTVSVTRVAKPYWPAILIEVPIISTILYVGYQDRSDLISIDLLEELTYEDEVEALGGVSANEITVTLDNSNKDFFFNNDASIVSKYLRRNRKIEPWLGTEVLNGEIEWYSLGVFWAYKWTVPVEGLTATVVGFDTIGLLGQTPFKNHTVQINKSIGDLIEYVLRDAASLLDFLTWDISDDLYEAYIPYAWFENGSHADALRRISQCYPMHIYCDRKGTIRANLQKLKLDYFYDVWSDTTNVISKTYDSLYTALPNIVNVTVINPQVVDTQLVQEELTFTVPLITERTLTFTTPYVSGLQLTVDCDSTVAYTYTVYSWGIDIMFSGSGTVRSITCTGNGVDISNTSVLTRKNEQSVLYDGAITRNIDATFIQTADHAAYLLDRLFSLSELDKFDVEVTYRGDIALSINDPILLTDGIAPDNRYNIKRHQLNWNGALSGSAYLNT